MELLSSQVPGKVIVIVKILQSHLLYPVFYKEERQGINSNKIIVLANIGIQLYNSVIRKNMYLSQFLLNQKSYHVSSPGMSLKLPSPSQVLSTVIYIQVIKKTQVDLSSFCNNQYLKPKTPQNTSQLSVHLKTATQLQHQTNYKLSGIKLLLHSLFSVV